MKSYAAKQKTGPTLHSFAFLNEWNHRLISAFVYYLEKTNAISTSTMKIKHENTLNALNIEQMYRSALWSLNLGWPQHSRTLNTFNIYELPLFCLFICLFVVCFFVFSFHKMHFSNCVFKQLHFLFIANLHFR